MGGVHSAHTSKMVALEKSRRDLDIDASLDVYTLLVVEKLSSQIHRRGCVIFSVIRYLI